MPDRHAIVCAAYLVLLRDGQVLMLRRNGTGWNDGLLGLPSGHVEAGESPLHAAIREGREEAGVTVDATDLQLVHVMSKPRRVPDRLGFFFIARRWEGEPRNAEPHKSSQLLWVPVASPPADTIPSVVQALHAIAMGQSYSESLETE